MGETKVANPCCPDCGRALQTVFDYPSNELWCVHCGNRYFATLGPSDSEAPDSLLGFRILLLDSACDRRDYLVRHFTRLGYQVTPVCHPRQALEAASFRRFDVTILPAALPEFECAGFVCKLKRLLGTVKFLLLVEKGAESVSTFQDPDVVWTTVDTSDYGQLERTLEQLIDEVVAAQMHHAANGAEVDDLVGIA